MRNSGVNDMKSTQLATHYDCLTLALYKEWWACTLDRERILHSRWERCAKQEVSRKELVRKATALIHIEALLERV